jgi:hypothetical protein
MKIDISYTNVKPILVKACAMVGIGVFTFLVSMILFNVICQFSYYTALLASSAPMYIAIRLVRERIEKNQEVNELLKMPEKAKRTP